MAFHPVAIHQSPDARTPRRRTGRSSSRSPEGHRRRRLPRHRHKVVAPHPKGDLPRCKPVMVHAACHVGTQLPHSFATGPVISQIGHKRSLASHRLAPPHRLDRSHVHTAGHLVEEHPEAAQQPLEPLPAGLAQVPAGVSWRRLAVTAPTPLKRRTGSRATKAATSSGGTTNKPSGLLMPEATFAMNLLGPTPADAARFVSCLIADRMCRARIVPDGGPSSGSVTSR